MSEIINETINELNKPTQNNVFSIEDDPVTVLEKINQVERYLKQIDTHVDTSINTANEALEKANNAFEANGTLVKINGENQLTWSADFAESERQKSKNLFDYAKFKQVGRANYYLEVNVGSSIGVYAPVGDSNGIHCWIEQYDENKTLLKGSNYWGDKFILQLEPTTKYIRFDSVSDYAQFMICYANSVDEIGDYQPYNGAIVHEKEIADVEHIDLIYEMLTKNTIGGVAYTAGIPFSSITISNVDFTSCKSLRFTCSWNYHGSNWFGGTITFDLDLTTPYNSDAEYISVISNRPSNCYISDDALTFDLVGRVEVNGNKNLLNVNGYKITYTGERTAFTSDNYLQYFRIEKIEGIR